MAIQALEVNFTSKTHTAIFRLFLHILEQGYPDTAQKFYDALYAFGNGLSVRHNAHTICRHKALARSKMRCAIFKKNYIFIYRVEKDTVVIYNVIYGRRNPASFSA